MNNILKIEFERLVEDLILKHESLGMRSSGNWANSLETVIGINRAVIWGESYTQQLALGRKPGAFPPIKSIEQWILDKPISLEAGMKISTLAFLIARKIAKEGTDYFKQGGTDLIDSVITPERIQSIIDKVSEFQINEFTSELVGVFKQMAA